jgi:hypothetical protein
MLLRNGRGNAAASTCEKGSTSAVRLSDWRNVRREKDNLGLFT